MKMRTKLIAVLAFAAVASFFAESAIAQTNPSTVSTGEYIPDAINRAFFSDSGDIYRNANARRQVQFLLGIGSPSRNAFPENEIRRDAERIEVLYRDLLEQQISSDPLIRTPDLANPFNTSLKVLGTNQRVFGGDLILEAPLRR
jgi:hypothetical protein